MIQIFLRWYKKRGLFLGVVTLSLVSALMLSFPFAPSVEAQNVPRSRQSSELRGVWLTNIDSDVLFERDRLSKALQNLKQLNFNVVYPTVWNWGYTLYPSKVAQSVFGRSLDPEPRLQGRDILKEIVDGGHQQGLTVIPWFEFGFMAPADSDLAKRHPEWLTNRRNGTKIVKEGSHERVWLSPFRRMCNNLSKI